ncbi:argininosuccinate lyase [Dethiosulfatibacter aminovorans DSM 17477]|uniref:Argininosuccinate lyase n=1 Tax=Dethiosulfatibacter aminovorans DSM 17477 TaxID=1121476 RepID=A0A1M6APC9_9FIRM|nr:argininosuccinate lyase [Dethiosulfatibacter aminovorans]SHI38322.1 argininosuccinate lyase [Dethiosulfatibacter aminovorans DSM 17477]
MTSLWGGRFEKSMDDIVKTFNASIGYDQRLYKNDIEGSIAHVTMLAEQGIVTVSEKDSIIDGLNGILQDIESGKIVFDVEDEDIHMGIESRLIARIGDVGKKLHTARSRNDQCQVDGRMYLKDEIREILNRLVHLESVILEKAEKYADKITVGFTHMQHAQPVTIGFHFMAYFQMFRRDIDRLLSAYERMDLCPLGACALAGTTLPTNRHTTAKLLGFSAPTENAMDSVSDRDYCLDFLSAASISMMHLSRWAEEFVWWNSQEFSYIEIDDSYCTGSSIMPQKKNPDMAELLRGKVGRVYGDLTQLLTVMKGTPLAYNKDFQEDKEGLFDAVDTWKASVEIFANMLEKTDFRMDMIEKQLDKGFLNATDIAEQLVKMNIPFREAHEIVGKMVKICENKGCILEDLTDDELQEIDLRITRDSMGDISIKACVDARTSFGGTAPTEVGRQIEAGKVFLDDCSSKIGDLTGNDIMLGR